MKNFIFSIVFVCLLMGCGGNDTYVQLTSNNVDNIDSIKIYSSKVCPPLVFKNVKKGETVRGNLSFCKALKSDGSYGFEMFINGKLVQQRGFGDYSNGHSLNTAFEITIDSSGIVNIKDVN